MTKKAKRTRDAKLQLDQRLTDLLMGACSGYTDWFDDPYTAFFSMDGAALGRFLQAVERSWPKFFGTDHKKDEPYPKGYGLMRPSHLGDWDKEWDELVEWLYEWGLRA